ncbi:MAG: flagellar biosynthetic protein FliQ [Planctomycetota bacterium]
MEVSHLDTAVDVLRGALFVVLKISLPLLGIGLVVGLAVSLLQAVTQIQEQTLSFIPKILAIVVTMLALAPLFLTWMVEYTGETIDLLFSGLGR